MTKLYYSESGLNKNIVPNLDSAIKNLETCKDTISYMDIPLDFEYRNYLLNFKDYISTDMDKIKNVKNFLSKSSAVYSSTKVNNIELLASIDNISIKLRENLIKKV